MGNHNRSFSSQRSLHSSSHVELKQVFEHVSNVDIHETVKYVNQTYEKAIKDLVRVSSFLFTIDSEDQILSLFFRNGKISSAKLVKGWERESFGTTNGSIAHFGRKLVCTYDYVDEKWTDIRS